MNSTVCTQFKPILENRFDTGYQVMFSFLEKCHLLGCFFFKSFSTIDRRWIYAMANGSHLNVIRPFSFHFANSNRNIYLNRPIYTNPCKKWVCLYFFLRRLSPHRHTETQVKQQQQQTYSGAVISIPLNWLYVFSCYSYFTQVIWLLKYSMEEMLIYFKLPLKPLWSCAW